MRTLFLFSFANIHIIHFLPYFFSVCQQAIKATKKVSVNLWCKKTSILQESADCYQLDSADSYRMENWCIFFNINAP
jgi:hypothetical protein